MATNKPISITIPPQVFNDVYLPLINNQDRYLVLMGGGGSGKSKFAAQKIVLRALQEQDTRFLVLRKVASKLRESVFQEIKTVIEEWGVDHLFNVQRSHMKITCRTGSEILFLGLDDLEKVKSISSISNVWLEETTEFSRAEMYQIDIRMRQHTQYYQQMIITFNPISSTHWLKAEFFDNPKTNATTLKTTYRDNRFLPQTAVDVLLAFKETDPYYFSVYAEGQWGVYGETVFNAQLVHERLETVKEPTNALLYEHGEFSFAYEHLIDDRSIQFIEGKGNITIFRHPKPNVPYFIAADPAGEGSDAFAIQVIDNITSEQVAVFHGKVDEDFAVKQLYCLGIYYNTAMICVESNFSTYPTRELQRLNYKNQYVRQSVDSYTQRTVEKFGFSTNKATRTAMISNLVAYVKENVQKIHCEKTLNEMLNFIRNEKGRAEAAHGAHDDLVISLAIAHFARGQMSNVKIVNYKREARRIFGEIVEHEQPQNFMSWS